MGAVWQIVTSISILLLLSNHLSAQSDHPITDTLTVSEGKTVDTLIHQIDAIDIGMRAIGKDPRKRIEDNKVISTKLRISAGPILEYMKATGFAAGAETNGAFLTEPSHKTNLSSVLLAVKYTQRKQFLLPIQSSIWLPRNEYYFLGDWRYMNYPQDTYGFGAKTHEKDVYIVAYKYIRFYETIFKKLLDNFYVGGGYRLDYRWQIAQLNVAQDFVTDFTKYGYSTSSTSSGLALSVLYDTRRNSINPVAGGFYTNIEYRQNFGWLGSSGNWNRLQIDIRKYIGLSPHTILAFWSYNVFTLQGNPPYLDLPSTGSDTYNNTGRGYEQGRFLGKNMIDLEAELRFRITRNGLLGGVVFANAESLSEFNNRFEVVAFAFGVGLRVKFNKFSNANACLDYGVGGNGSSSFFGNLGEVF